MSTSDPANRPRLISRGDDDRTQIVSIGKRRVWLDDSYVRLLAASWSRLFAFIAGIYLLLNLVFGLLYYATDGIQNAHPGSFGDDFFFSVQTLSTIGYGQMYPAGLAANIVVTLEALTTFVFYAVVTGLIFSKFSRPSARVLFSDVAVVCPYEGAPHLMIRMANERRNRIVDARAHLVILRNEESPEGIRMRRFVDLKPVRGRVPILQLTWTLMHKIDETSPLYGTTTEALCGNNAELIVSLTGLDETLSQTIHTRYSYKAEEILFDRTFEDIIERRPDGKVEVHYPKFHRTRPLPTPGDVKAS